ncbi:protein POLR1D-like isoform X2 [Lampris incognitus]|uniref:protein POLR1D-like isoform X2 n=1 Tax=Lampris incognitus TaxID=2546036 RepID=UPI0024B52CC3|nr:protein POLR1D-like isoform X2 [Lampris incognitus]
MLCCHAMADDSELEKMKCPLRGTNKRFLLNTLRSTGLMHGTGGPSDGSSAAGGHSKMESRSRCRSHSRTPPRDHRANGGHRDRKRQHGDSNGHSGQKRDGDKDKSDSHKEISSRYRKYRKGGQSRDSDLPQSRS